MSIKGLLANRRVLLVEDTDALRWLFTRFLRRLGFEVCEAKDGEQALDMLKIFEPDILITDLAMPAIDGIELIRRVRATRAVPIIAMTALVMEGDRARCFGRPSGR